MVKNNTKPLTARQLKVGEELKRIIASILSKGEVYINGLDSSMVVVSEVRISPDFSSAKVFVSPLVKNVDMDSLIENLYLAKGQIKKILGGKICLRLTPDLTFLPDDSFDEAEKIELLLHSPDVKRDLDEC